MVVPMSATDSAHLVRSLSKYAGVHRLSLLLLQVLLQDNTLMDGQYYSMVSLIHFYLSVPLLNDCFNCLNSESSV